MIDLTLYRQVFEVNPLAILLVDQQFNNVETNPEFCRLIGVPRDQVLSMKITDFRERGIIRYLKDSGEKIGDAVRKKEMVRGRSTLETPAGRIEVLRTMVPLLDERGELRYIFISYNDISAITKNQ